jgi:sulfur-oxidizing protein SoxZ
MTIARIAVPRRARRGEVIQIRTLISHVMETGFRRDEMGRAIARDILNRFTCTYNGAEVFRADLFPAIAANPFITFHTVATQSGELVFTWTDDQGSTHRETARIEVT